MHVGETVTEEEILKSHVACLLTYKFPCVTTSAFPNRGWRETLPPHLKGNINSPIKLINCAMFSEYKTGQCFSAFHNQEIPRRNGICSVTARSFKRSKNCYLFFHENTSGKFLILLFLYFDCKYRLHLLLFSLIIMAFPACTCEPVGIQHSFEFLCMVSSLSV